MKKVSEVIKMAIPLHANSTDLYGMAGLCFILNDLQGAGAITLPEKDRTKALIYSKLHYKGRQEGYLSQVLKKKKKASNLAARVAFYERLVAKLEKQGL